MIEKLIKNMSKQEKLEIASRMFSPLRCGGAGWDNGKYYLILGGKRCFAKEINDIIRKMNPKWTEESLRPYLYNEEKQDGSHYNVLEDTLCK